MLAAQANGECIAATMELAKQATRFDGREAAGRRRAQDAAAQALAAAAGAVRPEAQARADATSPPGSRAATAAASTARRQGQCLDIDDIARILAESRDPAQLLDVWRGWHAIAPPMRERLRALRRARERGRARARLRRHRRDLALEVRHAARRLRGGGRPPLGAGASRSTSRCTPTCAARLAEKYGADVVPPDGPIPGAPARQHVGAGVGQHLRRWWRRRRRDPGYDLTALLKAKKVDAQRDGALRRGLLHLARLRRRCRRPSGSARCSPSRATATSSATPAPGTSTTRTTCASRCASRSTRRTSSPIHHELGHNFYQRAYNQQPFLFRDSANDGFHEAIGDTIALSITPEYLEKLGLLDKAPRRRPSDIGLLLQQALDKIAFLPFGLLIDQWRWKVFSGEITPGELQRGVVGAASEVPGRRAAASRAARPTSTRARSTTCRQRALHALLPRAHPAVPVPPRAVRRRPGSTGPLHRCSIYGNKEAGERLRRMLEMGAEPALAGGARGARPASGRWTPTAILDYFAPLKKWLDEQNRGKKVGF